MLKFNIAYPATSFFAARARTPRFEYFCTDHGRRRRRMLLRRRPACLHPHT
jgi:hypothetical protein